MRTEERINSLQVLVMLNDTVKVEYDVKAEHNDSPQIPKDISQVLQTEISS